MFKFKNKPDADSCGKSKYSAFIAKNQDYIGGDLYTFFYGDFFHDSRLDELRFCALSKRLKMKLLCPDMGRDGDNLSVRFVLEFWRIKLFTVNAQKSVSDNFHGSIFMTSEIGTLISPRKNASIIMDFLPDSEQADTSFQIGIIFDCFICSPAEPLAFEILKSAGRIRLPHQ